MAGWRVPRHLSCILSTECDCDSTECLLAVMDGNDRALTKQVVLCRAGAQAPHWRRERLITSRAVIKVVLVFVFG